MMASANMPIATPNVLLIAAPFCIYDLRLTSYDSFYTRLCSARQQAGDDGILLLSIYVA
jgi:hypothetical protein